MTETVASLAALVEGRLVGDGARPIRGIADLRTATAEQIGFVRDGKYRAMAKGTRAGAVITAEPLDTDAAQIVVADVSVAFARVALCLHPVPRARQHSIHPTAIIDPGAELEAPVEIGPHAVIGRARIGAGTVVMAGASVGDGCRLGSECVLYPRVVLYHGLSIGNRVILHAGAVLGSDGFGYAREGQRFVKVPQLGSVTIADDVEIGANCTIDRGAMGDTRIGARTKIDNLCHIAHNCVIGEDCAFAAATFVAGSTVFGDRVILAGHLAISGHLNISSDVRVGGNSCILRDIEKPGDYMGHPLMEKNRFFRLLAALRGLMGTQQQVDRLVKLADRDAGAQG